MSAPTTRPVLPRTSSAASGLRFCGMIEEPVEKASERRTKPNCGVVHSTISSAKRDRCVAQIAAALKGLEREVAVGDAVERIGGRPVEAERLRRHLAVDREGGAGERRRAERAFVEALARVARSGPASRASIST